MIDEKKKNEKFLYRPAVKLKDAVNMWFCYPFTYICGMSSLGFLSLFRLLDEREDVKIQRIFSDSDDFYFNKAGIELAGFSVSFEMDFLGVFKILEKSKIPLKASERNDNDPLVFAGGPVMTANSEPFADFFDFVILGDGEEVLNEIVDTYKNVRHCSRKEKLLALSKIKGVYVPSLYTFEYAEEIEIKNIRPTSKVGCKHTTDIGCLFTPILTPDTIFKDTFVIETSRGCPRMCRFCLASFLNLPARYPEVERIKEAIDIGVENSNKIALLGALITDHPDFNEICEHILKKREEKDFELSVSSLRVDTISPLVIKTLTECHQKTSTISIEAGTERLRNFINKNLPDEKIFEGVRIARENGLKGMKIYGMIGLPSETDEDIEALIDLMKKLKKENKGFPLTLSLSSFVPKAQTPFQWEKREDIKTLEKKSAYIKKSLAKVGIDCRMTSIKWDFIQAVLSRGDRRLSDYLLKVHEYGGNLGSFTRAYKELKNIMPSLESYGQKERQKDDLLPWDIVETGICKETLYKLSGR